MYVNISILGQPAAGPALILDGRRDQTMEFSEDFFVLQGILSNPQSIRTG